MACNINYTKVQYIVSVDTITAETIIEPSSTIVTLGAGLTGPQGAQGNGVPVGGNVGQILTKKSNTDYDTKWVDSAIGIDTGWSISGSYIQRKTIDVSNYTQGQLLELLCTLIDTLKLSKIPSE